MTLALEKIHAEESALSVETFAEIVDSVAMISGPSETMYSNVFDLTNGIAHVYYRHDFERVAVLDMAELETNGEAVTHRIAQLVAPSE